MRRLRNAWDMNPEPPNIVRKMATVILAKEIQRMSSQGRADRMPGHYAEEMAMRAITEPDRERQRVRVAEAMETAWAIYNLLEKVLHHDMQRLEMESRSATWWW